MIGEMSYDLSFPLSITNFYFPLVQDKGIQKDLYNLNDLDMVLQRYRATLSDKTSKVTTLFYS